MKNNTLEKYIKENQLTSCMNNTKWRKMVREITSDENFNPSVCIKIIYDNQDNTNYSPVWWEEVERDGYNLIEWLKINPIKEKYIGKLVKPKTTDYTNFIKAGLDKCSISYEMDNGIFKIYGYQR